MLQPRWFCVKRTCAIWLMGLIRSASRTSWRKLWPPAGGQPDAASRAN